VPVEFLTDEFFPLFISVSWSLWFSLSDMWRMRQLGYRGWNSGRSGSSSPGATDPLGCHRRRISDRPPRSGVPLTHGPEAGAVREEVQVSLASGGPGSVAVAGCGALFEWGGGADQDDSVPSPCP
jgi:hypothetical protein